MPDSGPRSGRFDIRMQIHTTECRGQVAYDFNHGLVSWSRGRVARARGGLGGLELGKFNP